MYGEQILARVGVVAFAFSLITPAAVGRIVPIDRDTLVAATSLTTTTTTAPLVASGPPFDPIADAVLLPVELRATREVAPPEAVVPPAPTSAPPGPYPGGPFVRVVASWYGPGFYENRLPCWRWLEAKGLPIQLLPDTWGVAHKTLPCGTMLLLRHGANEISVPVVDRGPYVAGRELDLSPRVKAALGCTDLCTVLMRIP